METSPEQDAAAAAGILEYGPGTSKTPAVEDEEALGLGVVEGARVGLGLGGFLRKMWNSGSFSYWTSPVCLSSAMEMSVSNIFWKGEYFNGKIGRAHV